MSTYSNRISSLNPKLWYRFNESSGVPTNSGSLTQTASGSPTSYSSTVKIDEKSANYSGTTYSSLSNLTAGTLFDGNYITLEVWFKHTTISSGGTACTIYHFADNSTSIAGIQMLLNGGTTSTGKLSFNLGLYGYTYASITTASRYDDNNWHHAVVTIDRLGGYVKLYIDSVLDTSYYMGLGKTNTIDASTNGKYISAGRYGVSGTLGRQFNGYIDEFAVYGSVLTGSQIQANYLAATAVNFAAIPMTAASEMPKVLAVHDVLYNLALQRNAAYIFKLNSTLNDVYCATSGHTFSGSTSGQTYLPGKSPSITGGAYKSSSSSPGISYNESTTPIFDNIKGTTLEFVFYLDTQVISNQYKVLFSKYWGESLAVFLNANGTGGNTLGFQIDYTNYEMFVGADLQPGNWHHVVVEWGAKDNKLTAYINGTKYQSSSSYNYNLNHWNDSTQYNMGSADGVTLDYVAVYNTEFNVNSYLSDDDVAIHYSAFQNGVTDMNNSINFVDAASASALMANPSESLGITAEPMSLTISAEMVNPYEILITMNQSEPMLAGPAEMTFPQNLGTVSYYSDTFNASATTVTPTITAIDNELYYVNPFTVSADFANPFWAHDSGLDTSAMGAEAILVEPVIDIAGRVRANAMIATGCTLVYPEWETFGNARFEPQVLTATAFSPTPPSYILLTDDDWFNRLYAIHSRKKIQPIQTVGTGTNLPNQSTTEIAGGSLLFFNDVASIVRPNTTDKLTSTLPKYLFEDIQYDENGDPIVGDTTKRFYYGITPSGSISPTPGVFPGSFDPFGRKAVNIKNIEFNLGDEQYASYRKNYSVEFTIKTTKSDQIISYGRWKSNLYYGRSIGTIGLYNGKLYGMETYEPIGKPDVWPHPSNTDALKKAGINSNQYFLGTNRIDDGLWHHIIIQAGWTDNRMQIWIDGKLDSQLIGSSGAGAPGRNQIMTLRPYILGHNSTDELYSDFETSGYSWSPAEFLLERDINLNYNAAFKYEPIKVKPMLAGPAQMVQAKGKGNRPRALMLYFWTNEKTYDTGEYGKLNSETFDSLSTSDLPKLPPEKYYGWDIFPLGVLSPGQSDLIKPEVLQNAHGGYYRNTITDTPRYLDVVNDVDLSLFDAIFFRNYPDQTRELDTFAREEIADSWAGTIEKTLYEDFVKTLRNALDTGISLYVTNHQLAQDLGIIKYAEVVPDLSGPMFDEYSYNLKLQTGSSPENNIANDNYFAHGYLDTNKNNYYKVINEFKGITDIPGYIWNHRLKWKESGDDQWKGEIGRIYEAYQWKDELLPGETYLMHSWGLNGQSPFHDEQYEHYDYYAVHKDNVITGKPIFGFADTYMRGTEVTANPYKDYVQVIALEPGTMLGGKPIASRVFVSLSERVPSSRDWGTVDLVSDEWINLAYQVGRYTLAERNAALTASYNLDRKIEAEIAGLNRPDVISRLNALKSWSNNADYRQAFGRQIDGGNNSSNIQQVQEKSTKNVKMANVYNQAGWDGGLFFTFSWSYMYPRMTINLLSPITRGFNWLATREEDFGTVNRVPAMMTHAEMLTPTVTADKDRTAYAPALVASAKIVTALGYAAADFQERPVPMTAYGVFSQYSKVLYPAVFTANASLRTNIKLSAAETDQVVLYLEHVDPIVYLREEVIK